MKAIVCEVCKSNSFTKLADYLQCDFCRTKYTVEQAQKLFVEGAFTIDRTVEAANILDMAQRAMTAGDAYGAIHYARRVLEIDSRNPYAWQLVALGSLATQRDSVQIIQALDALRTCMDLCPPELRVQWGNNAVEFIKFVANPNTFTQNRLATHPTNGQVWVEYGRNVLDLVNFGYGLTGDLSLLKYAEQVVQITAQSLKVVNDQSVRPTLHISVSQLAELNQRMDLISAEIRRFEPNHQPKRVRPLLSF